MFGLSDKARITVSLLCSFVGFAAEGMGSYFGGSQALTLDSVVDFFEVLLLALNIIGAVQEREGAYKKGLWWANLSDTLLIVTIVFLQGRSIWSLLQEGFHQEVSGAWTFGTAAFAICCE